MRTYIKAYMSLNFGQIPPLTTKLASLERLKNRCHHVISDDIDPIFFKLAGNKDMHNIMNEFEFRPDRTTDYGVSCPWASKKYPFRPYNGENGVSTFSLLFLIGSFWYFHVTRTSIKAWMSSNFFKWDLTLAHWTQVSDRCPLGYLFFHSLLLIFVASCVISEVPFIFSYRRFRFIGKTKGQPKAGTPVSRIRYSSDLSLLWFCLGAGPFHQCPDGLCIAIFAKVI